MANNLRTQIKEGFVADVTGLATTRGDMNVEIEILEDCIVNDVAQMKVAILSVMLQPQGN